MLILPFILLFIFLPTLLADYGDTIATARLIAIGELIDDGKLQVAGDIDFFYAKLISGRTYSATVGARAPIVDINFKIYEAGGSVLALVPVGTQLAIPYTPSTTGYYYFRVMADDPTVTGAFDFTIGDQTICSDSCTGKIWDDPTEKGLMTMIDCEYEVAPCASCSQRYVCSTCSNSPTSEIIGGWCYCDTNEIYVSGNCYPCSNYMTSCETCTSTTTCTSCSGTLLAFEDTCVSSCGSGYYSTGVICESCGTVNADCQTCDDANTCTSCSGVLLAFEDQCVSSCGSGYYSTGVICESCDTVNSDCLTCDNASTCKTCSGTLLAFEDECLSSCYSGYYSTGVICESCDNVDSDCLTCDDASTCTSCSGTLLAVGSTCINSCADGFYSDGTTCLACSTIDASCTLCESPTECLVCSGDLVADGPSCANECSTGTYDDNGYCTSCTTLDTNCLECSNALYCSSCDNSLLISGPSCVSTCPSGTTNSNGICTSTAISISLSYGSSATSYLATFSSALVNDIGDVISISTITLADIDTSVYSYTMTKRSTTVYQIDFTNTQNIAATTLTLKYTLTGTPATTNVLIGQWTAQITTKYMSYISEADKEKVETMKTVAKTTMQAATIGAGSLAILGGNPALLWPLLNIFQAFYYLIFINVNYPENVKMFLQIFSLGSLDFIPNPMDWIVSDLENYSLPAPEKYEDFEMSGLFLENAGNEMLILGVVFFAYVVSKIAKKWIRRLPMSIRQLTNKVVGWFEWSGILNSLTTSYTDLAQAIFLQLRVSRYSSGVFAFSSILSFVSLIFIVILPIYAFAIIRRNEDYPELLYIKYDALAGEYDIKKKAGRYFVPIWLIRRLVMILSLVFLQGSPYAQITILSIVAVISIIHAVAFLPFSERKENICNGLTEVLFGLIHIVIFILVHDDHNLSFSDQQRLTMGWAIIIAFGIILVMSLGLSLIEQIKDVKRAIKLIKKLLSKPEVKKKNVNINEKEYEDGNTTIENQNATEIQTQTTLSDQFSPNVEKHNSQVQRFNWNKSRNRSERGQFLDVNRNQNNSSFGDFDRSRLDTSIDSAGSPEFKRNQYNNNNEHAMVNHNYRSNNNQHNYQQRYNGNGPIMMDHISHNNSHKNKNSQQRQSGNGLITIDYNSSHNNNYDNQSYQQKQNGNGSMMINNNNNYQQQQRNTTDHGPRIIPKNLPQNNNNENQNQRGRTQIPVSQIRQMRRARLAERIRELREINS